MYKYAAVNSRSVDDGYGQVTYLRELIPLSSLEEAAMHDHVIEYRRISTTETVVNYTILVKLEGRDYWEEYFTSGDQVKMRADYEYPKNRVTKNQYRLVRNV